MNKGWYSKRITAFLIFIAVTVLFTIKAKDIKIGSIQNQRYSIYSIEFNYYGVDARKIEKLITIPLEEKISALSGLCEYRSSVEYGKSTTTCYFSKSVGNGPYLLLRSIVDTLHLDLPPDVQKPHLYCSNVQDKAVVCYTFSQSTFKGSLRTWIDSNIKHELEQIEGVSEVIVTGESPQEITANFDARQIVAHGQTPSALSTIIQDANAIIGNSSFETDSFMQSICFDTKLHSIEEIKRLPIKVGESYTELQYFADIKQDSRVQDEIVRVNGEPCVSINVKSASDGNAIAISRSCESVIDNCGLPKECYKKIYDTGKETKSLIKSVVIALVESFICIIILIPFFYKSRRVLFLLILAMLADCLSTAGQLCLFGFSLDQNTIAGISIALGLIADSMLVISESVEDTFSFDAFVAKIRYISPSIISASLTTSVVLIPLLFFDFIVPGVRCISLAIILMLVNSIVLALVFFLCFIYSSNNATSIFPRKVFTRFNNFYNRQCLKLVSLSIRKKKISLLTYIICMVIPFAFFLLCGKSILLEKKTNIVFVSVEFIPEKCARNVDESISLLIKKLTENNSILYIRSECKKGSADIEICFDDKKTTGQAVANYADSLAYLVTDGFVFVPGAKSNQSHEPISIEMAVLGDDEEHCRSYAKQAAYLLSDNYLIDSVVLNFKQNEKELVFTPSISLLSQNNISVQSLSFTLRWILFGPVADKWVQDGEEQDIRIRGKNFSRITRESISQIQIPIKNGSIPLHSLGTLNLEDGAGKIYRKDGRRAAFFTVESHAKSTSDVTDELHKQFGSLSLEKGYCISFPREIQLMNHHYSIIFIDYSISILGVLILLIALSEDIRKSLLMISIISASTLIPLAIRFFCNAPLALGDIIGMVVLSGISINNSIYIGESHKSSVVLKVREKARSILATSLTTIVGAIPLLFVGSEGFSANLAFFMFWGILNSTIVAFALFPGVMEYIRTRQRL